MADKYVKVCPKCGHNNYCRNDKCELCNESLREVEAVLASSLPQEPQTAPESRASSAKQERHVHEVQCEQPPARISQIDGGAREQPTPRQEPVMKKICPLCHSVNPANSTTCSNPDCCGDILSVPSIPEDKVESELARLQGADVSAPQSEQNEEQVRLCDNPDCNHINPVNVRQCAKCGGLLTKIISRSDAEAEIQKRRQGSMHAKKISEPVQAQGGSAPVPQTEPLPAASATLAALADSFAYIVKEGTVVLGRTGDMKDYLKEKTCVSRSHAELTFKDGYLSIKDIGSTNGTYVNSKKLKINVLQQLKNGDIVSFAASSNRTAEDRADGVFFRVELH